MNRPKGVFGFNILIVAFLVLGSFLMSSCGGGIVGSGDGLPDNEEELIQQYHITRLPTSYSAAIPSSLIDRQIRAVVPFDLSDPAETLKWNINNVVDNMLAIALAQLYLDAEWEQIRAYCEQFEFSSSCALAGSGITAEYTAEMALWETNFRSRVEQYEQWNTSVEASDEFRELYRLAEARVGSRTSLDSVVFSTIDPDSQYDYIVDIQIEVPSVVNVRLSWTEDLQTGAFSTTDPGSQQETLSTSFEPVDGQLQHKFTLASNLQTQLPDVVLITQALPDSDNSFVASSITQIGTSVLAEIASKGLANEVAAYLRSDSITYNESDTDVLSYRQSIEEENAGTASCIPDTSLTNCTDDIDWTIESGQDPSQADNFLSDREINEIRENYSIDVISLRLQVPNDPDIDSYAIMESLDRDPDDFDDYLENVEGIVDDFELDSADNGVLPDYDQQVLCRVYTDAGNREGLCATSIENLLNAFIVGEKFDGGDLDLTLLPAQDYEISIIE